MKREEVYKLIDGERDYQEALPPARTDGSDKSVGDYILMLEDYIAEARQMWTRHAGSSAALHSVRKVAGIAVHCMEDHGAPPRLV